MSSPRLLLLAGPTAVGKSEIALILAEQLGGEIISVDSMQVYRGMDVGTAKPSPQQRARVPHHLIDVVEVTEGFDAAKFARLAGRAIEGTHGKGRLPILCGGTGLYFRALLEGLGESPAPDPQMRAELEASPLAELLDELARRDPASYEGIDRENPRRIIRAVEIIRLTGKPVSQTRAAWNDPPDARGNVCAFGFWRPLAELRVRIDARVDGMFARGLVAETEALLRRGLDQNRAAMQALGYRQVVEHLRGKTPLAETIALVKVRTRQFAKRQMTWFRRQAKLQWMEIPSTETAAVTARRVCALFEGGK